uniref:Uncharacterized protein n=1 Tax=Aegilops tauschii TaxID=37682 RepID=N1QYP2_AEGTA
MQRGGAIGGVANAGHMGKRRDRLLDTWGKARIARHTWMERLEGVYVGDGLREGLREMA